MTILREIEETPEHDAIVSAAEYIGIKPQRFATALLMYQKTLEHGLETKLTNERKQ